MSLPYFVHDGAAALAVGASVELTGDEGRHATAVRRLRAGEQLVLTDGAGAAATCTVTETAKSSLTATVDEVTVHPVEEPHVTVVQAIPKGERAELAVEMLTEVGVDVIVPWPAERCVSVWRGDRATKSLAKWRATAREAAKQARRPHFPEVTEPAPTEAVAALLAEASVPVVLHEAASGPIGNLPIPGRGRIVVVVGPEGGISEAELAAFGAVGAEPVRLGSSVLRTSTAGVAAVAALLARTRRWG
jgi:16S rRNA (uracil1498-N3)-methyltransferase